jgi:hypothetical protein
MIAVLTKQKRAITCGGEIIIAMVALNSFGSVAHAPLALLIYDEFGE